MKVMAEFVEIIKLKERKDHNISGEWNGYL